MMQIVAVRPDTGAVRLFGVALSVEFRRFANA